MILGEKEGVAEATPEDCKPSPYLEEVLDAEQQRTAAGLEARCAGCSAAIARCDQERVCDSSVLSTRHSVEVVPPMFARA